MRGGPTGTPGGAALRGLRKARARTQLWVELQANLGSGYLQRVESGRVAQPERPTLERILDALAAGYVERREILERFGYAAAAALPTEAETAWAREACRDELAGVAFPAYLLDCAHRLVAWNALVPPLFGIAADDPTLGGLAGASLLAAWFVPGSPLAGLPAEPDAFLAALVRAARYELRRFAGERWQKDVEDALLAIPAFAREWAAVAAEPAVATAARALVPVRLRVPGCGTLQFRLSTEPLTADARFRVVYYFPGDPATMRCCAWWAGPRAPVPHHPAERGRPDPGP